MRNSKGRFEKNVNNGNEDLKPVIIRPGSPEAPKIVPKMALEPRTMNTSYLLFVLGLIGLLYYVLYSPVILYINVPDSCKKICDMCKFNNCFGFTTCNCGECFICLSSLGFNPMQ
jgi:hypothetical protein